MFEHEESPNDKYYIDKKLIALMQESLLSIKIDEAFAFAFYDELFAIAPHLRVMFSGDRHMMPADKFAEAFGMFTNKASELPKMHKSLKWLGVFHLGKGVTSDLFPIFEAAILKTLAKKLGDEFTPEVYQAWARYLSVLSAMMNDSMREANPDAKA